MGRTGSYAYRRNREAIVRRGGSCGICGRPVDTSLPATDPMGPSADHIIPVVDGGSNAMSNLRLTHLLCNMRRNKYASASGIIKRSASLD